VRARLLRARGELGDIGSRDPVDWTLAEPGQDASEVDAVGGGGAFGDIDA
jgi:hypothetical protein